MPGIFEGSFGGSKGKGKGKGMDDIFKLPKGDSDLTDTSGKKKAKKKKGKQKFIETPYGRFPV